MYGEGFAEEEKYCIYLESSWSDWSLEFFANRKLLGGDSDRFGAEGFGNYLASFELVSKNLRQEPKRIVVYFGIEEEELQTKSSQGKRPIAICFQGFMGQIWLLRTDSGLDQL